MNERRIRHMSRKIDEALGDEPPVRPPRRSKPKKWYQSKTLVLHIANAVQAILVLASQVAATRPNGTLTQAELLALGVSITTIILRVLTDQPIEGGPKS